MGSPAVDPFAIALDEATAPPSRVQATDRAVVALVVAVQFVWIAALAYAAYVFLM